jgi:hypothetical protein
MKTFYIVALAIVVLLVFEHFLVRAVNDRLLRQEQANNGSAPTSSVSLVPSTVEMIEFLFDSAATTPNRRDYTPKEL